MLVLSALRVRLQDSVVLVTGASEGIGAACAGEFRRRGAKIALVARNKARLDSLAVAGDLAIPADLLDPKQRYAAVESALAHFGRIDILVNNAGLGVSAPAWRAPMDDVRHMFELNFFAALDLAQLVVPGMRERRTGAIVNVGSVAGQIAMPWFTLYSSTKFALGAFTDGLRMELAADNIHAMLVCPGFVATDFHKHVLGGPPPGAAKRGRPGEVTPQRVAVEIAEGLERGARTVVVPRKAWALVAASRLFPALVDRILMRANGVSAAGENA
ncbi:MAG: SDR family NAD(P)-dependent oxidoreductase [Bryobacteraceae bacterium]|nr:SDR family NAD(P)-dependent oxidoreductase [Bryobacteraceae bacterium]